MFQCISMVVSDHFRTARIGVIHDIMGGQHMKAMRIMHVRYLEKGGQKPLNKNMEKKHIETIRWAEKVTLNSTIQ